MFRLLKVKGDSLAPEYVEGDYVVVTTIPFLFGSLKIGDIIVFKRKPHGILIKEITYILPNPEKPKQKRVLSSKFLDKEQRVNWLNSKDREIHVLGRHEHSVDSRHFGPIRIKDVLGKVIWHIRKPIG